MEIHLSSFVEMLLLEASATMHAHLPYSQLHTRDFLTSLTG